MPPTMEVVPDKLVHQKKASILVGQVFERFHILKYLDANCSFAIISVDKKSTSRLL